MRVALRLPNVRPSHITRPNQGCFHPFPLVDESQIVEPFGKVPGINIMAPFWRYV